MTRHRTYAAAAISVLALACPIASRAQSRSSIPAENEALARQAAVDTATQPILQAARARPYIGGYWQIVQPVMALSTIDGKTPPLNSAGLKAYRQVAAERRAGRNPDPMDQCLPPGTPRSLTVDKPFMIAHAAVKITFFHQIHHVIRHVYLDGPLKITEENRDELWEGTSSGRWEQDTLVIETANFNGRQWLDDSGLPQSVNMRVTERIRRLDEQTLENVITYDDATYYSRPWTARLQFRALPRSTLMAEEDCAEKLLDFPMKPYAPE